MLQLATAAFGKVPARRLLMCGPRRQRAVVEHGIAGNAERHVPPAGGHSVSARSNANDKFVQPSGLDARPESLAPRSSRDHPAARRFPPRGREATLPCKSASNAAEAPRPHGGYHPRENIPRPGSRQPSRRPGRESQSPVRRRNQRIGPLVTITAPDRRAASSARSAFVPR